jgi:predicted Rossmann fold flavoprotein
MRRKIIVIGGGAAGLIAAISASEAGAEVTVVERMNRVGKKLLATGNGRCNLTNINTNISRYHGKCPEFIFGAFKQFDVEKTIDFFESLGIVHKVEDGGKAYPFSDQASSVLDVLRYEITSRSIDEVCEFDVDYIKPMKNGFLVSSRDGREIKGDKVILAAGGKASPNLGSNGSGYTLAKHLGHSLVETFPALVQLNLEGHFLKSIKGVKLIGEASVGIYSNILRKESGEILFTDYGISGPPILQLSRSAGEQLIKGGSPWIEVDMFPDISDEALNTAITGRLAGHPDKTLEFSFVGLLNKRLIPVVLKQAGILDLQAKCGCITREEIERIVSVMKHWRMKITGTQSWSQAQVTAGGVEVKDIDAESLQSKIVHGLYFAGEILDIDGDCGGFNLQWAWSSGYTAGMHAAID